MRDEFIQRRTLAESPVDKGSISVVSNDRKRKEKILKSQDAILFLSHAQTISFYSRKQSASILSRSVRIVGLFISIFVITFLILSLKFRQAVGIKPAICHTQSLSQGTSNPRSCGGGFVPTEGSRRGLQRGSCREVVCWPTCSPACRKSIQLSFSENCDRRRKHFRLRANCQCMELKWKHCPCTLRRTKSNMAQECNPLR